MRGHLKYTRYSQHCLKSYHICGIKVVHSRNSTNETSKGKLLLLCGFVSDVKRSTVIGSCTESINTPLQLFTLNVMGALCDLFDASMDNYYGKFTSGKCRSHSLMQFSMKKGQFIMVKVSSVTSPVIQTQTIDFSTRLWGINYRILELHNDVAVLEI